MRSKTQIQPSICSILFRLALLCFLHHHVKICKGISVSDLQDSARLMGRSGEIGSGVSRAANDVGDGECLEAAEDEMDSEINKRVLLMRRRYISYATLTRDLVPCATRGASYYNCRYPGEANSYNRGCEVITRCARVD